MKLPDQKNISELFFFIFLFAIIFSFSHHAQTSSSVPLSSLGIPEELGKVQERFNGTGTRHIIYIQDVHAHTLAQENIAAILNHLHEVYGIRTVALEGAWSTTNLPKSRAIKTSREKQLLARTLLSEDYLSGPIYAALFAPSAMDLVGIEDPKIYEENRKAFLKHLNRQPDIALKLRSYAEKVQAFQNNSWSPELFSFAKAFADFRRSGDPGNFFSILLKASHRYNVDFSDLEQIVLLQEIMGLEVTLSQERLKAEIEHLMRDYKNTSLNLEELIRSGQIPPEKLGFYPEIKKLVRLFSLHDQVILKNLMAQIETLTGRILEKLVKTQEEKVLWEKSERLYLMEKILFLKATPSDLKSVEREKADFDMEIEEAGLTEDLSSAAYFYTMVKQRDDLFYEKVMKDPFLEGSIAIVTGGFHADGLSQKFRDAKISYTTLIPELGNEPPNERLYLERMREDRAASQTLSELQNATATIDNKFFASYELLLQTKDVRKAVMNFMGSAPGFLKESRSFGVLDVKKFMTLSREEQLSQVRAWLNLAGTIQEKAMLVTQLSILKNMLQDSGVQIQIDSIVRSGDILAMVQDVPVMETPEGLLAPRGIERFEVKDIEALLTQNPKFQKLAKRFPFVIMKEGYQNPVFVVLPEKPVSLKLYRMIALNPELYRASRNPEFLILLEGLVDEVMAKKSAGKSA